MELSQHDVIRLRRAMATTGTRVFAPAFRNLVRARVTIATCLLMRFDAGRAPALLDGWLAPSRIPQAALREYLDTTYPFDPFFQFHDLPRHGGLYRLSEIAPDRFFSSQYFLEYYRNTGLCDEVGLLVPLTGGARAHVSISRLEEMGPFKRRDIRLLRELAPVLLELLAQHVIAVRDPAPPRVKADTPGLPDLIRSFADDTLGTRLTRREGQIASLVLQGHSNGSSALALGIARETCKVHRRNLYRKLAISSQRELFGLLKHLL